MLGAAALQVLAVTWAPLRDLLGTRALTPADAVVVTGLAALPGVVLRVQRLLEAGRRPTAPAS